MTGDPILVEHASDLDTLLMVGPDRILRWDRAELPPAVTRPALDPLTPVGQFAALPGGTTIGSGSDARRVRLLGVVLCAAMLLGVSDAALAVARDYALEREQFGVPIGSFQALKHIMADMFVRTGLARSATYAAAAASDDPDAGDPLRAASAAKILAGQAALENARAAIQVLGGMGFTWHMPPHYLLKRAWVLEHSFGTADAHALAVASSVEAEAS